MQRDFHGNGSAASPSLIAAVQKEKGPWAHAILGQAWSMPKDIRTALINGEVEWQIKNAKTITITTVESP